MMARTIFETVLIIAGWGLVVGAIASAIGGDLLVGALLFIGSVVAFSAHARSMRAKPSSAYVQEFEQGRRR